MAQSLSCVPIHLVFSTKNREPLIDDEVRQRLHHYIIGGLHAQGCVVRTLNSVEDHIHVLFDLSRTLSISQAVKEIKAPSSSWMKDQGSRFSDFAWQSGYGAFGVSPTKIGAVTRYIAKQAEHHRETSFQSEYREFLVRHDVEFDERYVWD